MYMKNPLLFSLMAILLLGGTITPALSQSSDSNSIVINEVEINPINGAEFVELYNPTSDSIDVSGWSLNTSASWKKMQITPNTIIEPQSFLAFTHTSSSSWFKDFGDTVSLNNISGELIDETHILIDHDDDGNTWQRITDGLDTDSESDWEFKRMTPKSSNGKIVETVETIFSFTAQTDKSQYNYDDTLAISGAVSEILFQDSQKSTPEFVKIIIQGPNYYNALTINPDRDLNFSAELNIKKILGFNLGNYNVDISYGENSINTDFTIIDEINISSSETDSDYVEIFTDNTSYIPGETVIVFANTNSSIEYAGLDYVILDPNGKPFSSGTIFPNSEFSTVHQSGGGQLYPFSTKVLLHAINPVFGTYEIQGILKAQDPIYRSAGVEIPTTATFQLVEDVKEETIFTLSTDKEVYSVDDTIIVTGRSNQIWTENVDLNVQQTGVLSRATDSYKDQYTKPDPFVLQRSIDLNGDGTFEFQFRLIESFDSEEDLSRYFGDYKLTISEYFGTASVNFQVVENPESFVDVRTPLGLRMDKFEHVLGTAITVYGKVLDYDPDVSDNFNNFVKFTIADSTGRTLMSEDRRTISGFTYEATAPNLPLTFTAIPDTTGNYQISTILSPIQFDIGKYTINVIHPISKITESIGFEIITAQSELLPTTETQEPLIFELCSSTRNNISEIIKDLKQIGKGEIPPSMESVDCDHTTDYVTGEKLVIRGQVALKDPRSLGDSETNFDQRQSGSSYTTNYAQAELNYIELSIPYPQTITISGSYQTTPDEGEDYHGGGGSGAASTSDQTMGASVGTGQKGETGEDSNRNTGYDGQAVLQLVKKNLIDMKTKAYPDSDGNFVAVFDLRAGIFFDGIYKVKADYYGYKSEQSFLVTDNSLKGGLKPQIVLDFDRTEYVIGETVSIFGQIKNVYYYDSVSLKIDTPDVSKVNCLVGQSCGFGNTAKKIRVGEGVDGATFFMNYKIPSDALVGKYTVTADTHFGEIEKSFFVISESDVISASESSSKISKVIEKFNRIADDDILITLEEKSVEELILVPRVIQGSLFTSARGDESNVNLQIISTNGQCIIGQNSDCLVSESTRKPGAIYSIVSIDDINYKIRYSGNDVRLEKFSIIPEDSSSKITIDSWNVKIIKDEQPTRFYYKVSYMNLE